MVHGVVVRDYTLWYLSHGRLLIGNPDIKKKYRDGFVPHAGTVAALSRRLRKILKILSEVQKDPAHALCGHGIESMVNQIFEEARHAIPPDVPFCDADSSYYTVSARGRSEGRSRARGCIHPRGRPRNADVHELFNEPSPSTPVVPSESIPNMSGAYSMRPIKLLSRPAEGRPRRDVEAVCLRYGSAIGDGYMLDTPVSNTIFFRN
ncbi:hypothetical protein BC332_18127 [Capsicum chinense]|nr:hypothetical protein BC332_18127 [Capsicum chinense]